MAKTHNYHLGGTQQPGTVSFVCNTGISLAYLDIVCALFRHLQFYQNQGCSAYPCKDTWILCVFGLSNALPLNVARRTGLSSPAPSRVGTALLLI
ncbi:hypothetical protein N657DRAFT_452005 [Parathielavia appendiculata]|uniref:Uncharacterized protein n=1 Tax=Parathielavia appendiculata TaxID=2587402 RepID=A0AAN6Z386_9PEZI|nr:hypothetical protein N657DRAFT_452005 [Parathielavia appendiculata]